MLLYVEVPGAGTLRASAQSRVRVRSARRAAHGSRLHSGTVTSLATRVVASARTAAPVSSEGLVPLTLTLTRAYSSLASVSGGLSAALNVSFTAPGRPALRASLEVTFARTARAKVSKRSKQASKRRKGHASARRARVSGSRT